MKTSAHQENKKRKRILVVEDNPLSMVLMKQLFRADGYEILETPTGCRRSRSPAMPRLDRPHRPATRRDPELLPVSRAAELLNRSACCTRRERPATPQTADTEDKVRMRSECRARRSTAAVCGDQDFRGIRHSGMILIASQHCNI